MKYIAVSGSVHVPFGVKMLGSVRVQIVPHCGGFCRLLDSGWHDFKRLLASGPHCEELSHTRPLKIVNLTSAILSLMGRQIESGREGHLEVGLSKLNTG